ncbi:MAG: insulinase family protein, partial [Selenomonas sp.]
MKLNLKENETIHGFRLLKQQTVPEIDAKGYAFVHEKSGARLFFLENDDDNKVFSISFRTTPADDTGVAHIVEHSVLCGSRKYPLKEPFVELVKGSLNTFLNAMTFPDKTMYPVASRNDKDFQNLMDVYLDAVFYPAMKETPEIFQQEGWHYEIDNAEEPLRYSGVVYNEMKGALSSPDDVLENKVMLSLYPDTTYGFESGGDPDAIPTLTYEDFCAFHSRYYHPSNSYIYLYGAMDIEEKLAYLDREYLAAFDRIEPHSEIALQQPFREMARKEGFYSISEGEKESEKTFLALSWPVGEADDAEAMLALEILQHALLQTEAAPLKKALMDAKIGKDVSASFEDALRQPYMSIIVTGSEADRAEELCRLTEEAMRGLVENGIDKTLLEASINRLEFKAREADFGTFPKGLVYNIKIMNSWLYDADPALYLYYEELFQKMREGLKGRYFEEVLEKYLLKNAHRSLVVLKPSRTLSSEREAALAEALEKKKQALTHEEIERIIEMNKRLKERQESPETAEALATIPLLELSDIRREVEKLPLAEREIEGCKALHSDIFTNKIAYVNLYFDAQGVPQEHIPYLFLLTELLDAVDTESHTYAELSNLANLHTGGISYENSAAVRNGEPDSCMPMFRVRARAFVRKLPELFSFLAEVLTESKFADKKRIEELCGQCRAVMEARVMSASQRSMAARIASYLSPAGAYNEQAMLSFYSFIADLTDHFEERFEELSRILAGLLPLVFTKGNLTIGVTLAEAEYAAFAEEAAKFCRCLPQAKAEPQAYHFDVRAKNEGLLSSSRVQYVG